MKFNRHMQKTTLKKREKMNMGTKWGITGKAVVLQKSIFVVKWLPQIWDFRKEKICTYSVILSGCPLYFNVGLNKNVSASEQQQTTEYNYPLEKVRITNIMFEKRTLKVLSQDQDFYILFLMSHIYKMLTKKKRTLLTWMQLSAWKNIFHQ